LAQAILAQACSAMLKQKRKRGVDAAAAEDAASTPRPRIVVEKGQFLVGTISAFYPDGEGGLLRSGKTSYGYICRTLRSSKGIPQVEHHCFTDKSVAARSMLALRSDWQNKRVRFSFAGRDTYGRWSATNVTLLNQTPEPGHVVEAPADTILVDDGPEGEPPAAAEDTNEKPAAQAEIATADEAVSSKQYFQVLLQKLAGTKTEEQMIKIATNIEEKVKQAQLSKEPTDALCRQVLKLCAALHPPVYDVEAESETQGRLRKLLLSCLLEEEFLKSDVAKKLAHGLRHVNEMIGAEVETARGGKRWKKIKDAIAQSLQVIATPK